MSPISDVARQKNRNKFDSNNPVCQRIQNPRIQVFTEPRSNEYRTQEYRCLHNRGPMNTEPKNTCLHNRGPMNTEPKNTEPKNS